ncbi:MAG: DUF86 domain-containing protein [Thaumarchaeota archaeon]|nr:DUF86 domain-containing protein [Candidatus Geocrenenecus arthurdayi]
MDIGFLNAVWRHSKIRHVIDVGLAEKLYSMLNGLINAEALVIEGENANVNEAWWKATSYREAVHFAAERMGVTCLRDLESLVGLRNLLIHLYWDVEDEKIYQGLKTNFKCVEELLRRVERSS